jgi:hypothetical protein
MASLILPHISRWYPGGKSAPQVVVIHSRVQHGGIPRFACIVAPVSGPFLGDSKCVGSVNLASIEFGIRVGHVETVCFSVLYLVFIEP